MPDFWFGWLFVCCTSTDSSVEKECAAELWHIKRDPGVASVVNVVVLKSLFDFSSILRPLFFAQII